MLSRRDGGAGSVNTFEDLLGPASLRYFGDGFRRTSYLMESPNLSSETLTATVHIAYPPDWSQKNAGARIPHLSTIDAAILSTCMTETYLASAQGLTEADLASTWIESVTVRAGAAPLETIRGVTMRTTAFSTAPSDDNELRTSLSHRIGPMRATTVVRHPRGSGRTHGPAVDDRIQSRPHADLYRGSMHDGRVLELDPQRGRVTCAITLRSARARATGLESSFWPSVSVVDALVLAGQMAQILLYARQGMQRDATSTLWMRGVTIATQKPRRPPATIQSSMDVVTDRTLRLNGRELRSVDVVVPDLFGFQIESSLAL